MGKAPRECGVREARVTQGRVSSERAGRRDRLRRRGVLLVPAGDAAEILVRDPGGGPVSALGWDATGARLLFGLETGAAGLLNLPA